MEYLFWKNIDIAKGEPSKIQFHVYLIKVVISWTCLEPLVLLLNKCKALATARLAHDVQADQR